MENGFAIAIVIGIAIGVLGTSACSMPSRRGDDAAKQVTARPKITHFYANDPVIRGQGGSTLLCYGTEGATEVTLDPPVERLWPSSSRCFEVKPQGNTTYTITAALETAKVTQQLTIKVGPPPARILELKVDSKQVSPGAKWVACVKGLNVSRWEISAGKWIQGPGPTGGCFEDTPKSTTTYSVHAIGAMGEVDTEQVTVTVR